MWWDEERGFGFSGVAEVALSSLIVVVHRGVTRGFGVLILGMWDVVAPWVDLGEEGMLEWSYLLRERVLFLF